jgi:uncharacterized protein
MHITATNRLRLVTVLFLPIASAVLFTGIAEAQVFKDDQVCWSCSTPSAQVEPEQSLPVRRQKQRKAVDDAGQRPLTKASAPGAAAKGNRNALSLVEANQHKVAIQVDQNDKAVMDLALNNAKNIIEYYKSTGESVAVEIVTYGPGLHMLRADTSPVKERIAPMSLENPNLVFVACGNTQANQSKAEGKPITLISEAKVTPSGVVRLMELQKQGYAYIRP